MRIILALLLMMTAAHAQSQYAPNQIVGNPLSTKAPAKGNNVIAPLVLDANGLACPTCSTTSGTVTAVGLAMPADFIITNSPITTSGNLTVDYTNVPTGTGAFVKQNSPTLISANLGTPTSIVLTNGSSLPISTGVSGLASGAATWLTTPSSANLRALLTDETGTGLAYFQGGALGTPISGVATNLTGLPLSTGVTGTLAAAQFPALTGDITTSAGALATTLATVNGNVGSFGGASAVPNFTVNAKGLITAAGSSAYQDGTNAAKGVVRGDGTTISCSAGVCTSIGAAATSIDGGGATSISNSSNMDILYNLSGILRTRPGLDAGSVTNCAISGTVSSNALTVALLNSAGSTPTVASPCLISFRDTTAGSGNTTQILVNSAITFSTGATGSSFGSSNATPFRLWITAINSGSGVVLGVSNQSDVSGVRPLVEDNLLSTTACSACTTANAVGTVYSSAAQTTKPMRIIGYMEWGSGLTTAGVWASAPTKIVMMGQGIRRPGESIQSTRFQDTTAGSGTSSTTYIATTLTKSITLTSPVNLVKFTINGATGNTSPGQTFVSAFRGATQVGPEGECGSASIVCPVTLSDFDYPAVTSPTYTVNIRSLTGSVSQWNPFSARTTITLEEVMG